MVEKKVRPESTALDQRGDKYNEATTAAARTTRKAIGVRSVMCGLTVELSGARAAI